MPSLDRDAFKEEVRQANPVEEIIPSLTGAPLTGTGTERRTLCPFHDDHHPSLRVNPEKQEWFCDVCSLGGDVFEFVTRYNQCDFLEALAW